MTRHPRTTAGPMGLEVAPWVLPMLRGNARVWRGSMAPDDDRYAAHGSPRHAIVESAVLASIRDLILPGFRRFGVAVAEADRWLMAGAPS